MNATRVMFTACFLAAIALSGSMCFEEIPGTATTSSTSTSQGGTSTSSSTSSSTSTVSSLVLDDFEDGDVINNNSADMNAWKGSNDEYPVEWAWSGNANHTAQTNQAGSCLAWFDNPSYGLHGNVYSYWSADKQISQDYNYVQCWVRSFSGDSVTLLLSAKGTDWWHPSTAFAIDASDTSWHRVELLDQNTPQYGFKLVGIALYSAGSESFYVDDIVIDHQ